MNLSRILSTQPPDFLQNDQGDLHLKRLLLVLIPILLASTLGIYAASITQSSSGDLVAQYRFDTGAGTTAHDTAGDNDGSFYGNPKWEDGKYGKALSFDGNDYMQVETPSNVPTGSDARTIAAWVKFSSSDTDKSGLFGYGNPTCNEGFQFYTPGGVGGDIHIDFWCQNEGVSPVISNVDTHWHHIVGVWDGSKVYVYADGQLVDSAVPPDGAPNTVNNRIVAGAELDENDYFTGKIDGFRIYSKALNASEIKSLYNLGAARFGQEPTGPSGKVLDMGFNAKNSTHVFDTSGSKNHGEPKNGAEQKTAVRCKMGRCYSFDGNDDYVEIGNHFQYSETEPFTITFWVKAGTINNNERVLGFDTTSGWGFLYDNFVDSDEDLIFRYDGQELQYDDTTTDHNRWLHIALVHDGSGGLTGYVNGKQSTSTTGASWTTPDDTFLLGDVGSSNSCKWCGTSDNFEGKLDQVKIYDRALSQEEIIENTDKLEAGGATLELRFDSAGGDVAHDLSAHGNDGTLNPNESAGPQWTDGIQGNALDFDGSDDYVGLSGYSSIDFEKGHTVSAWINPKETSQFNYITTLVGKDASWAFRIEDSQGHLGGFYGSSGSNCNWVGSDTISTNNWYHVVFIYQDNDIWKTYINGKFDDQGDCSGSGAPDYKQDGGTAIGKRGGSSNDYFNGKIDSVRVYPYALSESKVKQLYRQGSSKIGSGELPTSCSDLPPYSGSGVYQIDPNGGDPSDAFKVYCEMDENGGGWIKLSMANAGADDVWVASYDPFGGNDILKCGGDETKYYEHIDSFNEADWAPQNTDVTKTININYTTAGRTLTESQEQAIRSIVTGVSDTTRSVGYTCDDDGADSADHNEYLIDSKGNSWNSQDGWTSGSNEYGWWIHHTDSANNLFETSSTQDSQDDTREWSKNVILPDEVKLEIGSGGGASWGYEKSYVLVKGSGNPNTGLVLDQNFNRIETCGQPDTISCPSGMSGKVAVDESGETNHGELVNGPTEKGAASCKVGRCLEFDGSNNDVEIPDDSSLDITDEITLSVWAKPEGPMTNEWPGLPSKYPDSSSEGGYTIEVGDEGYISFELQNGTGYRYVFLRGDRSSWGDYDKWYHVVGTWDRSSGEAKLYVNGKLADSGTGNYKIGTNDDPVKIGCLRSGCSWDFNGTIDSVRIYNRSLSEDEIWSLYTKGRDRSGSGAMAGPAGWWRMDDGGTTTYDSGGENDGDLGGNNAGEDLPERVGEGVLEDRKYRKQITFQNNDNYDKKTYAVIRETFPAHTNFSSIVIKDYGREVPYWAEDQDGNNITLVFPITVKANEKAIYDIYYSDESGLTKPDYELSDVWNDALGHFMGTKFHLYVGQSLIIWAYEDNTVIDITDNTDGDDTDSVTLNTGERYYKNNVFDSDEVRINSSKPVTVMAGADLYGGGIGDYVPQSNGWLAGKKSYIKGVGSTGDSGISLVSTTGEAVSADLENIDGNSPDYLDLKIGNTNIWQVPQGEVDDAAEYNFTSNSPMTIFDCGSDEDTSRDVIMTPPSTKTLGTGKEFWFHNIRGRVNILAYEDSDVTITDLGDGDSTTTINNIGKGTVYHYSGSNEADELWHVESTGKIAILIGCLCGDQWTVTPSESGFWVGTHFVTTTYDRHMEAFAFRDNTNIEVYNATGDLVHSATINEGQRTNYNPGVDKTLEIFSSKPIYVRIGDMYNGDSVAPIPGYEDLSYTISSEESVQKEDCASGRCLKFDGSDDYVDIPSMALGTSWTVSAWYNPDNFNDYTHIFTADNQDNFAFKLASGDGEVYFYTSGSGSIMSGRTLSTGNWYHLAVTYDGTNLKIFVNGNEEVSSSQSLDILSTQYKIGAELNHNEYSDGTEDEVRIYPYDLTQLQVKQVYNSGAMRVGG